MDKQIDPSTARLLALVEDLGGAAPVAKKMNKHPQLFYNLRDGKSKFSLTTLTEMAKAYPGRINANFILFGEEPEDAVYDAPVQMSAQSAVQLENGPNGKKWRDVAEDYRMKYERILSRLLERDHPELFADSGRIKMMSSSHPTDYTMGFQLSAIQKETANRSAELFNAYLQAGMDMISEIVER